MDIRSIPSKEDEHWEFKSSRTPEKELKLKISRSVAGFANSGGGNLVVGVGRNGDPDGGFPDKLGNQGTRDFLDQIIRSVEPLPSYTVAPITEIHSRGTLIPGNSVYVISVPMSPLAPHMASDFTYCFRAGAHTVQARHFLVESIRARQFYQVPQLIHLATHYEWGKGGFINLELVTATDAPALDVVIESIQLESHSGLSWPVRCSIIDRQHPLRLRYQYGDGMTDFEHRLDIAYRDIGGNQHKAAMSILPSDLRSDSSGHVGPLERIEHNIFGVVEQLEAIKKTLLLATKGRP